MPTVNEEDNRKYDSDNSFKSIKHSSPKIKISRHDSDNHGFHGRENQQNSYHNEYEEQMLPQQEFVSRPSEQYFNYATHAVPNQPKAAFASPHDFDTESVHAPPYMDQGHNNIKNIQASRHAFQQNASPHIDMFNRNVFAPDNSGYNQHADDSSSHLESSWQDIKRVLKTIFLVFVLMVVITIINTDEATQHHQTQHS